MALSSRHACRLIHDPPRSGAINMALDELLLDEVVAAGRPAFRFYQWTEPTLSLGYFQSTTERGRHDPSGACTLVRRPTGGGAIVHDRELTYGFVVPVGHPLAADSLSLYRAVHASLIDVLAGWEIAAEMSVQSNGLEPSQEPFLCFERRAVGDVVLRGFKIAGSAQRRPDKAILQHGSVLLRASRAAPELPGICDLADRNIEADELAEAWSGRLAGSLRLAWDAAPWTATELQAAARLSETKYAAPSWNERR